ncbi:MAG: hypothetical protein AAGJ18_06985 [Bacteroidota bacterium]
MYRIIQNQVFDEKNMFGGVGDNVHLNIQIGREGLKPITDKASKI